MLLFSSGSLSQLLSPVLRVESLVTCAVAADDRIECLMPTPQTFLATPVVTQSTRRTSLAILRPISTTVARNNRRNVPQLFQAIAEMLDQNHNGL
jgi:hypothetical protein